MSYDLSFRRQRGRSLSIRQIMTFLTTRGSLRDSRLSAGASSDGDGFSCACRRTTPPKGPPMTLRRLDATITLAASAKSLLTFGLIPSLIKVDFSGEDEAMRVVGARGDPQSRSLRMTRAASAALGASAFFWWEEGQDRTRGSHRHFALSSQVSPCLLSPGMNATYATAQGLDIINDASPSGVTTNPCAALCGRVTSRAKLTVSGDATSVATARASTPEVCTWPPRPTPARYLQRRSSWRSSTTDGLTFHVLGGGTATSPSRSPWTAR